MSNINIDESCYIGQSKNKCVRMLTCEKNKETNASPWNIRKIKHKKINL